MDLLCLLSSMVQSMMMVLVCLCGGPAAIIGSKRFSNRLIGARLATSFVDGGGIYRGGYGRGRGGRDKDKKAGGDIEMVGSPGLSKGLLVSPKSGDALLGKSPKTPSSAEEAAMSRAISASVVENTPVQCLVCHNRVPNHKMITIASCGHSMCADCLQDHLTQQLESRAYPIYCPLSTVIRKGKPACDSILLDDDLSELLTEAGQEMYDQTKARALGIPIPTVVNTPADTEVKERYDYEPEEGKERPIGDAIIHVHEGERDEDEKKGYPYQQPAIVMIDGNGDAQGYTDEEGIPPPLPPAPILEGAYLPSEEKEPQQPQQPEQQQDDIQQQLSIAALAPPPIVPENDADTMIPPDYDTPGREPGLIPGDVAPIPISPIHHCPQAGCHAQALVDFSSNQAVCPVCGYSWCVSCRCDWHQGVNCRQYQELYRRNLLPIQSTASSASGISHGIQSSLPYSDEPGGMAEIEGETNEGDGGAQHYLERVHRELERELEEAAYHGPVDEPIDDHLPLDDDVGGIESHHLAVPADSSAPSAPLPDVEDDHFNVSSQPESGAINVNGRESEPPYLHDHIPPPVTSPSAPSVDQQGGEDFVRIVDDDDDAQHSIVDGPPPDPISHSYALEMAMNMPIRIPPYNHRGERLDVPGDEPLVSRSNNDDRINDVKDDGISISHHSHDRMDLRDEKDDYDAVLHDNLDVSSANEDDRTQAVLHEGGTDDLVPLPEAPTPPSHNPDSDL